VPAASRPVRGHPAARAGDLDSLAEGVLLLDGNGRVVLANEAMANGMECTPEQLQGRAADKLGFTGEARGNADSAPAAATASPWRGTLSDGTTVKGVPMRLDGVGGELGRRLYMVNAAPIVAADGSRRGAIATFDDVTSVEDANAKLRDALVLLEKSRDELDRRNRELHVLATRDPLTGCLNRRSFLQDLGAHWDVAGRAARPSAASWSTWTTSRASTTASGTASATTCSAGRARS
jgi:hypothetical protein